MPKNSSFYVDLNDVIGPLALEYGLPIISFDNLIELGKRVVIIYNLDSQAKRITFETMCYYIREYVNTPFGLKTLKELSI